MDNNNSTPILTLILIFIDIYILVSLRQLHKDSSKCQCALTWHSKQLIMVGSVVLVSRILKLIYRNVLVEALKKKTTFLLIPLVLDLALSVYYIYLLVKYSLNLRKTKCDCLGTLGDVLYYYSNTIMFVVIAMVLMLFLILLLQLTK